MRDTPEVEHAFRELADIDITPLLDFQEFIAENGAQSSATGPDIQALMSKSAMHASLGRQRKRSANSADTALIPEGLGQDEHLRLAQLLDHPFTQDPRWSWT